MVIGRQQVDQQQQTPPALYSKLNHHLGQIGTSLQTRQTDSSNYKYTSLLPMPFQKKGATELLTLLKGMEFCRRMEGESMVILCRRKLGHSSNESEKYPANQTQDRHNQKSAKKTTAQCDNNYNTLCIYNVHEHV